MHVLRQLNIRGSRRGVPDRGAAAVAATIGMLLLLGLAALAIDGSNLYRLRSDVQNAADLAAYAAAYEECSGGPNPVHAGENQAAANGYSDSDPRVSVTVGPEEGSWRATIRATIDGYFSPILGAETLSTSATALAQCTTGPTTLPIVFAGGTCGPDPTLDWSGSDNLITGDIHSNDILKMGGANNSVEGEATYVTSTQITGSGNTFSEGVNSSAWQEWPLILDPSDYLPGGPVETTVGPANYHYIDGSWDLKSDVADGVYVATEGIILGDSNFTASLTLITVPSAENKGTIDISGSNVDLTPYYNNILTLSDYYLGGQDYPYTPPPYDDKPACGNAAIKIGGSNNKTKGVIYAARGMVEISGGTNTDLNASIIAFDVKFNGSDMVVTGLSSSTGGVPITVLVE